MLQAKKSIFLKEQVEYQTIQVEELQAKNDALKKKLEESDQTLAFFKKNVAGELQGQSRQLQEERSDLLKAMKVKTREVEELKAEKRQITASFEIENDALSKKAEAFKHGMTEKSK